MILIVDFHFIHSYMTYALYWIYKIVWKEFINLLIIQSHLLDQWHLLDIGIITEAYYVIRNLGNSFHHQYKCPTIFGDFEILLNGLWGLWGKARTIFPSNLRSDIMFLFLTFVILLTIDRAKTLLKYQRIFKFWSHMNYIWYFIKDCEKEFQHYK